MTALVNWFLAHPIYMSGASVALYHGLSAAIGALEMPDATSGKFYRWFFRFANSVAANYSRSGAAKTAPEAPKA